MAKQKQNESLENEYSRRISTSSTYTPSKALAKAARSHKARHAAQVAKFEQNRAKVEAQLAALRQEFANRSNLRYAAPTLMELENRALAVALQHLEAAMDAMVGRS